MQEMRLEKALTPVFSNVFQKPAPAAEVQQKDIAGRRGSAGCVSFPDGAAGSADRAHYSRIPIRR